MNCSRMHSLHTICINCMEQAIRDSGSVDNPCNVRSHPIFLTTGIPGDVCSWPSHSSSLDDDNNALSLALALITRCPLSTVTREPGLDPDKENKNRSAHKVRRHSQLSDSSLCRLNSVFIGIVRTPVGYLRSERRVGLN